MSRAVEDVDGRAVGDALLLDELMGFRAQFSDSECDGMPLRIRDETGEVERTEANLRAVLKDAADLIKALAEQVRVLEEAAKTVRADAFEEAAGIVETVDRDSGTWVGGTLCNVRRRFASAIRAAAQVKP